MQRILNILINNVYLEVRTTHYETSAVPGRVFFFWIKNLAQHFKFNLIPYHTFFQTTFCVKMYRPSFNNYTLSGVRTIDA